MNPEKSVPVMIAIALAVLLVLPATRAATDAPATTPVMMTEITVQKDQYEFARTYVTTVSSIQFSNRGAETIEIRSKDDKRLFAIQVDLSTVDLLKQGLLEPLVARISIQQIPLPYFKDASKLVLLDSSNHPLAETSVEALTTETASASLCKPVLDGQCDAACNRDIQDPDCGISKTSQQQAAQDFYAAGAALVFPQGPDAGSFLSPLQLLGLIAVVAVIIGLLVFGRKVQSERTAE